METIQQQIEAMQASIKQLVAHALSMQKHIKEKIPTKFREIEIIVQQQKQEIKNLKSELAILTARSNSDNPRFGMVSCDLLSVGRMGGKAGILIGVDESDSASISWVGDKNMSPIHLTADSNGSVSVSLQDKMGKTIFEISVDEDGHADVIGFDLKGNSPAYVRDDDDTDERVFARSTINETEIITCKQLSIVDDKGKPRIIFGYFGGQAAISFQDQNGKSKIFVGVDDKDKSVLQFTDSKGNHRIATGISANGTAGFVMSDAKGQERFSAGASVEGAASMTFSDPQGKERITLGTFVDGTVSLPTKDLSPPKKA